MTSVAFPSPPPIAIITRDGKHFVRGINQREYERGTPAELFAYAMPIPLSPEPPVLEDQHPLPIQLPPDQLHPEPPVLEERPPLIKNQIRQQKDLLIQNTTHFLTIQYLFETFYGFTPQYLWHQNNRYLIDKTLGQTEISNYALYTKLLEEAQKSATEKLNKRTELTDSEKNKKLPKAIEEELEIHFFDHIKELRRKKIEHMESIPLDGSPSTPRYTIWAEKASYFFKNGLVAKTIFRIFHIAIQFWVEKFISAHLDMLEDYKDRVGLEGEFSSTCKNELINNLNRCLTTLNGAYSSSIEKKRGTIQERVSAELITEDANSGMTSETLYKKFAKRLIVSTLGYYPGSVTAWILQKIKPPGEIVETLVKTVAGSAKDKDGYSHAVKKLLLEQLNQAEKLLKNPPKNTPGSKPVSEERKKQIATIVNQLIDLQNKFNCSTVDELTHLVRGTGFTQDIQRRYVETRAMAALMNTLVITISDLIESNVNENQIEALTLQLLKLTNASFMPPASIVTKEEKDKTEKDLEETTQRIIRISINMGIDRTLANDPTAIDIDPTSTDDKEIAPDTQEAPTPSLSSHHFWSHFTPSFPISFNPLFHPINTFKTTKLITSTILRTIWNPRGMLKGAISVTKTALIEDGKSLANAVIKTTKPLIRETAKKVPLIQSTAAEKVNGLYKIATERNVYLCALHHLIMIPYVETLSSKKKKS